MRTVVTGGSGVIGRAAVRALVGASHEVVVVTRSTDRAEALTGLGAQAVTGNVLDVDLLARAYEGADAVINLATSVPVGHNALVPGAWRHHDLLRTTGATNVVEAARRAGVRRVVQESVSFLYADQGDDWVTESSPVDITATTEPAAVGESQVQDYASGSRVGVVLRFGTIVGDDRQTRYWLRAARHGRGIGIGQPFDWAHVIHTDDLGGAVLASLHAPTGVYNVGALPVQREELVQGYAAAAGVASAGFIGSVGRWLIGPRLEPLARSLRVCSDHFAAQTGWRALRPTFDEGWLDAAREGASAPVAT